MRSIVDIIEFLPCGTKYHRSNFISTVETVFINGSGDRIRTNDLPGMNRPL